MCSVPRWALYDTSHVVDLKVSTEAFDCVDPSTHTLSRCGVLTGIQSHSMNGSEKYASFTSENYNQSFQISQQTKYFDQYAWVILLGVPESALAGHAFHTYTLSSPTVEFKFEHNVCGRRSYAEGTLDAVAFLLERVAAGFGEKRVFSMMDVLEIDSSCLLCALLGVT